MIENKETMAAISTLAFLGTTAVNVSADTQVKNTNNKLKVQKNRVSKGITNKMYGGPPFRDWRKQVVVNTLKSNTDEGKTNNKEKDFKSRVEDGNFAEKKNTIPEKTSSSEEAKVLDKTKNSTLMDTAGSDTAREKTVVKKPPIVVKDGVEGFWDWEEGSGWPSGWNTDTYVSEEGSVSVCFYGGPPIFRTKEEYEERYGKVDSNEQKSEEEVKKEVNKDLDRDAKENNVKDSSGDETTESKD